MGSKWNASVGMAFGLLVAVGLILGAGAQPADAAGTLTMNVSGPMILGPSQVGTYQVAVSGGTPPYSISCFRTTHTGVSNLTYLNGRVTASGASAFNVVCDVVDAASDFATDYVPVNVNGGDELPF